jgi:large subunit ribosomal protein L25
MSQRSTLQATVRSDRGTGALKRLRKAGSVPAVMYGKSFESKNLTVNAKALAELLHHSKGENILVNLDIADAGQNLALIQDVQHNPLTGAVTHLDFHAVKEDEKIHAHINLKLIGEPAGVKAGGFFEHQIHSLDIVCLPKDLPEEIVVDVSGLGLGGAIHIREVNFPTGVTPRGNGEAVIALCSEPRGGVAEAAPAAEAAADAKPAAKKAAAKK